jgi:hypothetical protein
MIKKMMLLATAIAALVAFVAPAAAQAEAIVTNSEGAPAEEITAFSTNTLSTTSLGLTLSCAEVDLNVHLTQNDTETALGTGTGTANGPNGGPCTVVGLGAPVTITQILVNEIDLDGGGTGTASFTYLYDTLGLECHFDGEAGITYEPGSDEIHIAGTLVGPGEPCPTSGEIHGDFTVLDEFGLPAELH